MSNADGLERKVLALERLLKAQESGLLVHSVIMTFDSRGHTEEGAVLVLREELERRRLTLEDFKFAGIDLNHVNLWWAEGRTVRFGDKAAGLDVDQVQECKNKTCDYVAYSHRPELKG